MKASLGNISRSAFGSVLAIAAVFALAGAALFEVLGFRSGSVSPLPFVGVVVAAKLGLFALWPSIHATIQRQGRSAGARVRDIFNRPEDPDETLAEEKKLYRVNRTRRESSVALWDRHDPRLDVALFAASVPTFVLSQDQRFLDWNPAFALVFEGLPGMRRGAHVSRWFKLLDNFRRLPKRTNKLYGEGILPITDRERVAFISQRFGRMVFTKVMNPIIDRGTGRIIGWTVVLNINSVNKRQEFFEAFFAAIAAETCRIRYAASYDGLFDSYAARSEVLAAHRQNLSEARRVLELCSGTGALTVSLLNEGRRVTAVESDVHLLRRLKDKCEGHEERVRIVRQNPDTLRGLPKERFDAVAMVDAMHRLEDPAKVLARVYSALQPGGVLSLSVVLAPGGIEGLYDHLRLCLQEAGRLDSLKHQLNHVMEQERCLVSRSTTAFPTLEELRLLIQQAGFRIDELRSGHEGGHVVLIKARKPR